MTSVYLDATGLALDSLKALGLCVGYRLKCLVPGSTSTPVLRVTVAAPSQLQRCSQQVGVLNPAESQLTLDTA